MLQTGSRFSTADAETLEKQELICTQNGIYFVNFISKHIEECYNLAKDIFEAERTELEGRETELAKHRWLQDYILSFAKNAQPQYMGRIACLSLSPSSSTPSA